MAGLSKGAPTPGQVFARRVVESRRGRAWTMQQLTKRLAEVGFPVDRMTVTRIEQGSRRIEVGEALAVAAALDVAPAYLLTPLGSDEPMSVAGTQFTSGQVQAWIVGDAPLNAAWADPDHYMWGAGPMGRNFVASMLRGQVKQAERASSSAELAETVRDTITALKGLLPMLQHETPVEHEEQAT